jgi:hypothetical protein
MDNYHIISFPGQPFSKTRDKYEMFSMETQHSGDKLHPILDLWGEEGESF